MNSEMNEKSKGVHIDVLLVAVTAADVVVPVDVLVRVFVGWWWLYRC